MRISDEMMFPHPVLADWRDDFKIGEFDVEIAYREDKKSGRLDLALSAHLVSNEVEQLIKSGDALFGIFVLCPSTGMRRLIDLALPKSNYTFAKGELLDTVYIRPMVWTRHEVFSWEPSEVHPEFAGPQSLRCGDVVALAAEHQIEVNRADLPALETIFKLKIDETKQPGEFDVNLDSEKITILAGRETYELIETLRVSDGAGPASVMNGLYVPAVMKVLSEISSESGEPRLQEYEGRRWVTPFEKRCSKLDIQFENSRILENALRILERPFHHLAQLTGGSDGG